MKCVMWCKVSRNLSRNIHLFRCLVKILTRLSAAGILCGVNLSSRIKSRPETQNLNCEQKSYLLQAGEVSSHLLPGVHHKSLKLGSKSQVCAVNILVIMFESLRAGINYNFSAGGTADH